MLYKKNSQNLKRKNTKYYKMKFPPIKSHKISKSIFFNNEKYFTRNLQFNKIEKIC